MPEKPRQCGGLTQQSRPSGRTDQDQRSAGEGPAWEPGAAVAGGQKSSEAAAAEPRAQAEQGRR